MATRTFRRILKVSSRRNIERLKDLVDQCGDILVIIDTANRSQDITKS